ncbi:MAG: hypothetical protein JW895_13310 [Thermoleophilaceae bacterium]|nr:hypothetical protein [Thermoleophilaceae bacterium]
MTTAVLNIPRRRVSRDGCSGGRGRRATLEESLGATLVSARAGEPADCPLCPGTMRAADGSAVCDSCGSTLS